MSPHFQPLALSPTGASVAVAALIGGREMQRRMTELGIVVGRELRVIRGGSAGPLVVAVGETRLALGQELSRKILVTIAP
ncbi:FeoA family protein [Rhodobacter ferrooxidans]|uniref:FeoA family protein n=1 Tax=Rhodobacter ferrooxidans TaxID=371731 RepID=C8S544_9RHOB|nr:FeoA family protein [Rhodobacter sp. SW2]EEW23909.1 FeoA family protein [Rhodobacter sp. SW2]